MPNRLLDITFPIPANIIIRSEITASNGYNGGEDLFASERANTR